MSNKLVNLMRTRYIIYKQSNSLNYFAHIFCLIYNKRKINNYLDCKNYEVSKLKYIILSISNSDFEQKFIKQNKKLS